MRTFFFDFGHMKDNNPGKNIPRLVEVPASPYVKISGSVFKKSVSVLFIVRLLRIDPPPFHQPTKKFGLLVLDLQLELTS